MTAKPPESPEAEPVETSKDWFVAAVRKVPVKEYAPVAEAGRPNTTFEPEPLTRVTPGVPATMLPWTSSVRNLTVTSVALMPVFLVATFRHWLPSDTACTEKATVVPAGTVPGFGVTQNEPALP